MRSARTAVALLAALRVAAAKPDPLYENATCHRGVRACESWDDVALEDDDDAETCAPYNRDYKKPQRLGGAVWAAGVLMCLMAYAVGANDAANSWATAVGSGAIGLARATIICGIFDWIGAVTLGAGVSDTVVKISDVRADDCWACGYCDSQMTVYAIGMMGALLGAALFLMAATFSAVPVSTTHAIVGGVVGMALAGTRASCVDWGLGGMGSIFIAWVASPALAGVIGSGAFVATEYGLIRSAHPAARTKAFLPLMYFVCTFAVFMLIMLKKFGDAGPGIVYGVTFAFSALVASAAAVFGCRRLAPDQVTEQRLAMERYAQERALGLEADSVRDALEEDDARAPTTAKTSFDRDLGARRDALASGSRLEKASSYFSDAGDQCDIEDFRAQQEAMRAQMGGGPMTDDKRDAIYLFRYLLIFTSVLKSFTHGANDTANATAAFSAVYGTWDNGLQSCDQPPTPTWIMALAGFFVCVGVYTLGYKVIETVGKSIAKVDFHTAWTIELGVVVAVVAATALGIPVSTTHCQVGAVAAVGATSLGLKSVNWSELGKIVVSWLVTLPIAGAIAAVFLYVFRPAVCTSCPWS